MGKEKTRMDKAAEKIAAMPIEEVIEQLEKLGCSPEQVRLNSNVLLYGKCPGGG